MPAACSGITRNPLPAENYELATVLGRSDLRFWGDRIDEGLLDEMIVYMAPTLMGSQAQPLLQLPLDSMSRKVPLEVTDVRRVGQDWRFTAIPG